MPPQPVALIPSAIACYPANMATNPRDHLEAIIARCQASPDPRALLAEQLRQLRGEFERADLVRMSREAVRRLNLGA